MCPGLLNSPRNYESRSCLSARTCSSVRQVPHVPIPLRSGEGRSAREGSATGGREVAETKGRHFTRTTYVDTSFTNVHGSETLKLISSGKQSPRVSEPKEVEQSTGKSTSSILVGEWEVHRILVLTRTSLVLPTPRSTDTWSAPGRSRVLPPDPTVLSPVVVLSLSPQRSVTRDG